MCLFQETKCISLAVAKTSKLSSTLHSSTSFKELFEQRFPGLGIPQVNSTRWNSMFRQIKAVLKLDLTTLNKLCEEAGKNNLTLTITQSSQLRELAMVLEPFAEATDICQGEKVNIMTHKIIT